MVSSGLVWFLSFLIGLPISELLEGLFIIDYGNGRFKFRFNPSTLNPFISHNKTTFIWIMQLVIAGLLAIPLGNYFNRFIVLNSNYYFPLSCLAVLGLIFTAIKRNKLKISRELWIFIGVLIFIVIISIAILTNWFVNFTPLKI